MIKKIIKILNEKGFTHAPNERENILRGEYVATVSGKALYGRNFSIIKATAFERLAENDKYKDLYFITKRHKYEKELHIKETEEDTMASTLAELFIKECGKGTNITPKDW